MKILGVSDILLSDKYNLSYIKTCPGSFKLYNCSELHVSVLKSIKVHLSIIKVCKLHFSVNVRYT